MKFLIIGSGGREHAIAWHIKRSDPSNQIYVWPGNAGMENVADIAMIEKNSENFEGLKDFVKKNNIDWTIVGPEDFLAQGVVDSFKKDNLNIFGPEKRASQLESSKLFAKKFLDKYKIPTAKYSSFSDFEKARSFIKSLDHKFVIKADGLAAGKGVYIPDSMMDAEIKLKNLISGELLGEAGKKIIIEEFVKGQELSYMIFTDGKSFKPLASSKDYKRLLENDLGLNTGGMGVYSPSVVLTEELNSQIEQEIIFPTIEGLRSEGIEYRGVLYIGLFITPRGPKVCEFNVRFGDPETQAVLMRLETPLVEIFNAINNNALDRLHISWSSNYTGGVVVASGGYPLEYKKNIEIKGLDIIKEDVTIFHAGTVKKDNRIYSAGGRVLNVMAKGASYSEVFKKIYSAIEQIEFKGMHFRKDICPYQD